MRAILSFALAVVVALALAILGTTPPEPRGKDAPVDAFSAARAMADIRVIAARPHVTGSPENAALRAYLTKRLTTLGFVVTEQSGALAERPAKRLLGWTGGVDAPPAVNIVARLPGTDPALPAVLLMAHYDSVWGSPAAADDGAGVASILEAARAIRASGALRRDVLVVFTDAEELGLDGARLFFADNPLAKRVGAIVNLEARGGGGTAGLFQTAPGNAAAIALYAGAVPNPSASSLSAFLYSVLPNDTDLSVPLDAGYAGSAYNIAFIGRSGLYHSPMATADALDQGSLQQMGEQTLALARALGNASALPEAAEDAVFFDAFGLATVHYPHWLGWIMLLVGASGLGVAWLRSPEYGGTPGGAGRMLGFLLASGVLLYGLNRLSGSPGEYYDRLAAIPKLTAMAGFATFAVWTAVFAATAWNARARIGAALPLVLLGVAGQAFAPTAAYFVVIPLLFAGLVEGAMARGWVRTGQFLAILAAALVTGTMLALGYKIMQGVGPDMPMAIALPAAIAALSLLPLTPHLLRWRTAGITAVLLALGVCLWVRFDPVATTVAAYASDKPG